mmetsp:Transcript_11355/g.28770  ORF Transcript_11355/g.28770 Transcript_11355/m.28770 type:complete len:125 (-) Transcript_11355:98-472(-)
MMRRRTCLMTTARCSPRYTKASCVTMMMMFFFLTAHAQQQELDAAPIESDISPAEDDVSPSFLQVFQQQSSSAVVDTKSRDLWKWCGIPGCCLKVDCDAAYYIHPWIGLDAIPFNGKWAICCCC